MRFALGYFAIPALMLAACAGTPEPQQSAMSNKGMLTVAGLPASQVLGAIDTSRLVKGAAVGTNESSTTETSAARTDLPKGQNAIAIEGVKPSDVLAAIDTSKLVDGDKKKAKN